MGDWYKTKVFYQIWTRSFCDGNGDGIGDLYGVYEKLEYIRSLGADGIWFSPIYPSPNADYGYDISDYRNIHPDFGDLEQFKRVLDRAHELGLKVIMDLVVNHTSDEHYWFRESRKGKDNPYSDYYIWRDGRPPLSANGGHGRLPNNWDSIFEGKAWEWDEQRGQYYLHIFAKKQPDLNMDNPKVREEVEGILRFWLDMGVDGFREDVITFISKVPGLPNGLPFIPVANGMPFYKDGPRVFEYCSQFRKVCSEYDCFQLGEGPMLNTKSALRYMTGPQKSLDLMFNFDHMQADCFLTEYIHRPFNLRKFKRSMSRWQYALNGKAWNSLYIENHDHPRVITRYGDEHFHRESGTSLAVSYLFQQGTPFIYQGQEIGMTNIRLDSIDKYRDVSSVTNYNKYHLKESVEKRLERIYHSSRDSSRTPMQWTCGENAGFVNNYVNQNGLHNTSTEPWFSVNPNYEKINVETQEKDSDSILNFYRRCLEFRKNCETALWGDYREYFHGSGRLFVYGRHFGEHRLLVVCSFYPGECTFRLPREYRGMRFVLEICNYPERSIGAESGLESAGERTLKPYEARVYSV